MTEKIIEVLDNGSMLAHQDDNVDDEEKKTERRTTRLGVIR